jgi:hypothetical protein
MLVTKSISWRRLLRGIFMPDLFNGSGFRFDRGVPPENHVGTRQSRVLPGKKLAIR